MKDRIEASRLIILLIYVPLVLYWRTFFIKDNITDYNYWLLSLVGIFLIVNYQHTQFKDYLRWVVLIILSFLAHQLVFYDIIDINEIHPFDTTMVIMCSYGMLVFINIFTKKYIHYIMIPIIIFLSYITVSYTVVYPNDEFNLLLTIIPTLILSITVMVPIYFFKDIEIVDIRRKWLLLTIVLIITSGLFVYSKTESFGDIEYFWYYNWEVKDLIESYFFLVIAMSVLSIGSYTNKKVSER